MTKSTLRKAVNQYSAAKQEAITIEQKQSNVTRVIKKQND
jgi:hypothetical protein